MRCPVIIAEHNERNDKFRLAISVQPLTEEAAADPVQAVRAAVQAYAGTPQGKEDISNNSGSFNWGDVVNDLPPSICAEHGFVILDTFVTELIVDHNELLNVGPDGEVIA